MNQENVNFNPQQSTGDLWGKTPGSVISGLLRGKIIDEEDRFEDLEYHWKKSLENEFSFRNLCLTFPEAKEFLVKMVRKSEKALKELNILEQQYRYIIERKSDPKNHWFWLGVTDELYIKPGRKYHETIVKCKIFLNDSKVSSNILNVERARAFPITNLIEFKGRVAQCIFHNDRNPSLYYYPNTNTVYCFACQSYADAIKVYQTINNCSFIDAVKKLQ